jgi:transporter family protein
MNPTALAFAVTTLLLWGVSPLFDKLGLASVTPLAGLTVRLVAAGVMGVVMATVAGTWREIATAPRQGLAYFLGSAVFGAVVGQLTFYTAQKYDDVSRVLPVCAAYPLVTAALAVVLLREGLTVPKVAGAGLIVAGIVLIGGKW